MDSLGLIYIRKVFSLFIYVTPERRYCDVKSESEIFDLRNRHRHYYYRRRRLASNRKMYCLRF